MPGPIAACGRSRGGGVIQTSIDGFRLTRIAPGVITLQGADTTLVLRTPEGGTQ